MEVATIATQNRLNGQIRSPEVRLISSIGEQLGIMPIDQAQAVADEQELDLVEISPQANPPVCKIMDYGKYIYERDKREKEAKKNQKVVETKEIRLSPVIDDGDFNTKLRNAQKFLADGNRVQITVRFKGRQMAHPEIGKEVILRFADSCADIAEANKAPKLEGRSMSMLLVPKAGKK